MKETGGPAFPRPLSSNAIPAKPDEISFQGNYLEWKQAQEGMTLRDYFAAKALPGVQRTFDIIASTGQAELAKDIRLNTDTLALASYQIADAMLKEREKE